MKLVDPPQYVSDARPKVKQSKNIETTVTFDLTFDEARPILIAYLKKVYPEFRRRGLEIELDFLQEKISCNGYKLEN